MKRISATFASLVFALALSATVAHAQTGSGTSDPNATNPQTQNGTSGDTYNTQQATRTDETTPTTSATNGYPSTTTTDYRDRGPDLGWLGLLGLVGLFGLKRRNVHHTREDEVRGSRPATV